MSLFSKTPIQQAEAILRRNNCDYSINEDNSLIIHLDDSNIVDIPVFVIIEFWDTTSTFHISVAEDTEDDVLSVPPERLDDMLYFANLCNSKLLRKLFQCMHVSDDDLIVMSMALHNRDLDEIYQGILMMATYFSCFVPAFSEVLSGAPRSAYDSLIKERLEIASNQMNRFLKGE